MKSGWPISVRKDGLLFFLILTLVAAFFLVIKLRTRFFVGQNDFWSLLFYARHLSWSEKASLYNGFYPIGYALLLRFFPYSYVIQLASLTNALFAGLLGASVFGLVWSTRRLGASIFALLLTVLFPLAFQYSTYLVPDIGSAALTAWAVFLLFKSELDNDHPSHSTNWQCGLAGIALGAASLWRSHAIISSLAIIVVYGLIHRMPFRRGYAILLVAFFIVAGIQPIVNLISGHGAFETAQKFNLYKTFYGIDWRTPPSVETIQDFFCFQGFDGVSARLYLHLLQSLDKTRGVCLCSITWLFSGVWQSQKTLCYFCYTGDCSVRFASGSRRQPPLPFAPDGNLLWNVRPDFGVFVSGGPRP
jgi:hypothetical protein